MERKYASGDRVQTIRHFRGLAAEDWKLTPDVPLGTHGVILLVQDYVTPFPYVVKFDGFPVMSCYQDDIVKIEN